MASLGSLGDSCTLRHFQDRHRMRARHVGEILQKLVERITAFDVLEQCLHGYSRAGENRRPLRYSGEMVIKGSGRSM
jgi:hypothetical protein